MSEFILKEKLDEIGFTLQDLILKSKQDFNKFKTKRKFLKICYSQKKFTLAPKQSFVSHSDGTERTLPLLSKDILKNQKFLDFITSLVEFVPTNNFDIDIFYISNLFQPSKEIFPISIEDQIHQDGYDYLGILCLKRKSLFGAENIFYEDSEGKKEIYRTTLKKGDLLFFQDSQIFHYVSPARVNNFSHGIREVLLLGFGNG